MRVGTREMLFQVACASLLRKLEGKRVGSRLENSSVSGDLVSLTETVIPTGVSCLRFAAMHSSWAGSH